MIDTHSIIHTLQAIISSPDDLKLLLGMSLGIKTSSSLLDEQMRMIGLTHIMVFSGSNVAFLMSFFEIFLRWIGYKTRRALIIALIISIPFVLRPDPSIIRATIMALIPLTLYHHSRSKTLIWHTIMLVASMMLIFDPTLLSNVSFQLSFAAVIGIAYFGQDPQWEQVDDDQISLIEKMRLYARKTLVTSLAAQSLTTPLIFYHFGTISLISPLANVLVGWAVAPVMILGMGISVVAAFSPLFGWLLYIGTAPLLGYIIWVTRLLSAVPYAQIRY